MAILFSMSLEWQGYVGIVLLGWRKDAAADAWTELFSWQEEQNRDVEPLIQTYSLFKLSYIHLNRFLDRKKKLTL